MIVLVRMGVAKFAYGKHHTNGARPNAALRPLHDALIQNNSVINNKAYHS